MNNIYPIPVLMKILMGALLFAYLNYLMKNI